MSDYQKHSAIEAFKRQFKTEHGVDVYVFLPKESQYKIDLNLLERCTYKAFSCTYKFFIAHEGI